MGRFVPYDGSGEKAEWTCRLEEGTPASEDDCCEGKEYRGSTGRDSSDAEACHLVLGTADKRRDSPLVR
jgi:hypothetical protein